MDISAVQSQRPGAASQDAAALALSAPPKTEDQLRHDRLTREARRLVSNVFYGTLLKQIHNSPFKSELFSGGRGGEAFTSLMDQHLADHMAKAAGRTLPDAIVRRIGGGRIRPAPITTTPNEGIQG